MAALTSESSTAYFYFGPLPAPPSHTHTHTYHVFLTCTLCLGGSPQFPATKDLPVNIQIKENMFGEGSASERAPPVWTLTIEEALDLQVADAEAQHGQLVQPRPDLLGEGQQAGELVQLAVETVSVAFGGV